MHREENYGEIKICFHSNVRGNIVTDFVTPCKRDCIIQVSNQTPMDWLNHIRFQQSNFSNQTRPKSIYGVECSIQYNLQMSFFCSFSMS